MFANRRFTAHVLLATSLSVGVAGTAAGCGSSPPAPAPATSSAAPSPSSAAPPPTATSSGSTARALLPAVISCLRSHGLAIPRTAADKKEIKAAFKAQPKARQESEFRACEYLLPADIRLEVQHKIAQQRASATATP